MKFGIIYNTGQLGVDPARITAVAGHAEDCGFESFYVPEHIALYPGARLGAYPVPPDLPLADPLATLSFVAAATRRILLGTSVLLLPFHHPVVLAKEPGRAGGDQGGRAGLVTGPGRAARGDVGVRRAAGTSRWAGAGPMTEYRASFDATVTFANGGGLAAHGSGWTCRLPALMRRASPPCSWPRSAC